MNSKLSPVIAALLSILIVAGLVQAVVYVGDVTEVYVSNPPFSEASYVIGKFNSSHYYARNCTNANYDWISTNRTLIEQYANAALSTDGGLIWCSQVRWNASLTRSVKVVVVEDYQGEYRSWTGSENAGCTVGCKNGTWIAHGLIGDPGTTGSITLSLRGLNRYNATIILRVPTIIQSNATHFQIEFYAWETTGWTLVPINATEAQSVYWYAVYKP